MGKKRAPLDHHLPLSSCRARERPIEAKKGDSVLKRQRQAEKRRVYNRSRKTAAKNRIKKVLVTVEELREEGALPKAEEDLKPIDELISLAYKEIDRAVSKGVMHKNTGA